MNNLYVVCGAPGLGKSTWVQTHLAIFNDIRKTRWVSRDAIRFSLVGEDESYFSRENEVYNEFIHQIKEGLKNHEIVIADATHLGIASRRKLLNSLGNNIRKNTKVVAIVITGSLEKALEQNEMRQGTRSYVPPAQVERMYNIFRAPTFKEDFDEIYFYHNENGRESYFKR